MNTSKTIVFFGTDDFSAVSLRQLIKDGFSIATVVTKPDRRRGRGQSLLPPLVKTIAIENNIPVLQPNKLLEIYSDLEKLDNPTGVLVSFGKIVPQSIIDLFSPGIINVHPSLLPRYRGPSPIEAAIISGDRETGVSIMQLSAAMDAGPIYDQTRTPLYGTETTPELEQALGRIGAERLSTILPDIMDGRLQPTPQNDTEATYCHLLQKSDSILDPRDVTAVEAERRVRAHIAFPRTKITILDQQIIITRAHVTNEITGPLDIACKDGILAIDELINTNGKKINAQSFINGLNG